VGFGWWWVGEVFGFVEVGEEVVDGGALFEFALLLVVFFHFDVVLSGFGVFAADFAGEGADDLPGAASAAALFGEFAGGGFGEFDEVLGAEEGGAAGGGEAAEVGVGAVEEGAGGGFGEAFYALD